MSGILQHLGWGLLHSLWIVTLLAAVYGVMGLFIPRRLRYCVGYALLLAMLILPALACFQFDPIVKPTPFSPHPEGVGATRSESTETVGEPLAPEPSVRGLNGGGDRHAKMKAEFYARALEILHPKNAQPKPESAVMEFPKPVAAKPVRWEFGLWGLASLWSLGVTVCSVRLLLEWCALRQLRRNALILEDGLWFERLQKLSPKKVLIAVSERLDSPILVGVFKPMILVPMSVMTGLTPAAIDLILSHELVHIRRYDYLANLVQLLVETLLFYHPLMWWVSERVRRDREYLCDDLVVARAETDRVLYVQTLVHLEQLRLNRNGDNTMKRILSTPAAMARPLMTRVHRILGLPLPAEDNRTMSGIAGAILLTLLAVTPLVFYFSQTGAAKPQTLQISPAQVAPAANQPVIERRPADPLEIQPPAAPMGQPSPAFMVVRPDAPMAPGALPGAAPKAETGYTYVESPQPKDADPAQTRMTVRATSIGQFRATIAKSPSVIRVYSLKEMIGELEPVHNVAVRDPVTYDNRMNQGMFSLVMQIVETQLTNEYPNEKIQFYPVAGKQAMIIAAPQPVHDAVGGLLDSLREVCEALKQLDGETQEGPSIEGPSIPRISSQIVTNFGVVAPYQPEEHGQVPVDVVRPEPVETCDEPIYVCSDAKVTETEVDPFSGVKIQDTATLQALTTKASQTPANPQWAKIEETEKKLETNVSLESDGSMTLQEAVELLQEQTGQFIAIDNRALEDTADVSPESSLRPVSNKDVPASLVLNRILKPLNLIYTINEDGDVVITTEAGEERVSSLIQVYDVRKYGPTMTIILTLDNTLNLEESKLMPLNGAFCAKTTYRNQKEIQKILASLPVVE